MNKKMLKCQRGALSLWWCAVLMAGLSLAAMTALLSIRDERNFFAEGWQWARQTLGMPQAILQRVGSAASSADATAIRQCMVQGKVVYSNVECDPDHASTRALRVHLSHGIEAPKVPAAAPAPQSESSGLHGKMLERAMRGD